MTILGSHVDPHVSNIGYMKVYEGLQALEGISSCVPRLIPSLGRPAASLAFCVLEGAFEVRLSDGKIDVSVGTERMATPKACILCA